MWLESYFSLAKLIVGSTKGFIRGKALSTEGHTHTIAQVTNLQTTLNGKANSSHSHSISQITNLQSEINSLKTSVSEGKALIANAITDNGGSVSSTASFSELAQAITAIGSSQGTWYQLAVMLTTNNSQTYQLNVADPFIWFVNYDANLISNISFIARIGPYFLYATGGSYSRSRVYCYNYDDIPYNAGAMVEGSTLTLYGSNITGYHIEKNIQYVMRYCDM